MITLASNSLRTVLYPARREENPGVIGTVLIVGVVALGLVGYGLYRKGKTTAQTIIGKANLYN